MAKPALGRGLSLLLGGNPSPAVAPAPVPAPVPVVAPGSEPVIKVALQRVQPCPFQPRKDFTDESLNELADSIRSQGVIQPLLVRRKGEGYEIIAGERRWRASQLAGLREVPIIIREADDRAVLELALIENLQRENLNPVEEAMGFSELIERFQLRQEDAAAKVGRSRASVANALRLLKLPMPVQDALRHGRLSTGHAKVLLGLPTAELQQKAFAQVISGGLSVRQTEVLVAGLIAPQAPAQSVPAVSTPKDPNVAAIETKLREKLGTKIRLNYSHGKGAVEIRFFSDDDLERILDLLGVKVD